ncbi:hypothetical protein RHSIM_Rhsim13G0125500 [Rhododendron simsii]|uniref:Uncharacterized protein n=1 Tax=Rhododendron simsii TaxID=118357 RepID=A0A834L605_RHOSS|nr:hypothetical protein RHSIM_Rhsim13G0125500 [Rhododendron simsii]
MSFVLLLRFIATGYMERLWIWMKALEVYLDATVLFGGYTFLAIVTASHMGVAAKSLQCCFGRYSFGYILSLSLDVLAGHDC